MEERRYSYLSCSTTRKRMPASMNLRWKESPDFLKPCIAHPTSIVNHSNMMTMLLPVLCRRTGNEKGKGIIGQSILFAGAGGDSPVHKFVDPVLERCRRSGQRSRRAQRQQHQDLYRDDRIL